MSPPRPLRRPSDPAGSSPTGGAAGLRSPYDSFNLGDHVGDDPADVAANRARVARELGVAEDRLVWMNQVHGTGVAVVDGPQDGAVPATDALVTATPGLVLCVLVADCVPVLLADHATGVVAAVHAGREGVRQGVVPAALSAMASLGARARHVTALLGPRCAVPATRCRRRCSARWPAWRPAAAVRTRTGTAGPGPARRDRRDLRGPASPRCAGPPVHRRGPHPVLPPPRRRHRAAGRAGLARLSKICGRDRPGGEPARRAGADRRGRPRGRARAVVGRRCSP